MRASVSKTLALTFFVLAAAAAQAQVPPLPNSPKASGPPPVQLAAAPGFVSTYEIVRTLRSAGFDPLAPPLREGTVYVARATDYRGILMRVVLDARTGAIRDANRIVPGPGNYNYLGPYYGGMYGERAYGPYGPGPYASIPYGSGRYVSEPPAPGLYDPGDAGAGPYGRGPYAGDGAARLPYGLPRNSDAAPAPIAAHANANKRVTPLPRPRPPELASRKSAADAKPATDVKPVAVGPKPNVKPDPKPAATTAASAPPPAAATPAAPSAVTANPAEAPAALTIKN